MLNVLKKYYTFVLKYKFFFLLSIFLFAVSSLLYNLTPVILRYFINSTNDSIGPDSFKYITLLLFTSLGHLLLDTLAIHISDIVFFKSVKDARLKIFKHVHDLDFSFHVKKSSGSMISLFKRGENAFAMFYIYMNHFNIRTLFDFLFMLSAFGIFYPKLLVASLLITLANILFMFYSIRNNVKQRKSLNTVEDKITGITVDNMIGFDTVKYFANEKYEYSRLEKITEIWRKTGMKYVRTFRVIDLGNGGIITIGMVIVIGIAFYDLINGSIDNGNFIMATTFATLFFPRLFRFVFDIREIAKNYVDLKTYLEVLDEPIQIKDTPKQISIEKWKNIETSENFGISFKDVDFAYDKKNEILSDINLEINPGESIALVGKSGAGKTTLTKLLMRFYDVTRGKIEIGGIDIKDLPKELYRKKIGFVPQEAILFNDTIGYNIAYGKNSFTLDEINAATKISNLYEFVDTLPENLMTTVGERGVKLSGGQKQRLAIARAIMENAPIIIFDEATSNLDSESEKLIQDAFWKIAENKTTIIIAHRLSTVQKADRIIVIDDGRIAEIGTHKELTDKKSGIYKYLWDLQTSGEIK